MLELRMDRLGLNRNIHRVGDRHAGELVIYDGAIGKIVGFKNRSTMFLDNVSRGLFEWAEAKVSVKDTIPTRPVGLVAAEHREAGMKFIDVVAQALERGLREKGLAAKSFVDGQKIDVKIAGERPENYVTLRFMNNGDEP